jgi:D-amino-acid dehydrogenase
VRSLSRHFAGGGGRRIADMAIGVRSVRGHVAAVVGRQGVYPCDAVIIAAGAWSRTLAYSLGDRVPLETERGYSVRLPHAGIAPRLPVLFQDHRVSIVSMTDGIRLTGMNELGGLHSRPDPAMARTLISRAQRLYPELSSRHATWWMSYRPSLPDSLPVIGRATRVSGAVYAFGHGHIGLTLAAVTARLTADIVAERTPTIDIRPLSAERFAFHRLRTPTSFGGPSNAAGHFDRDPIETGQRL